MESTSSLYIKDCAIKYIKSLNLEQRNDLKTMLANNGEHFSGIAESYNVKPKEFVRELINIFQEEEIYKYKT